jgi:hypothetical protein
MFLADWYGFSGHVPISSQTVSVVGKLPNKEVKSCSHGPIEMQPQLFPGGTGRGGKKESIRGAAGAPTEI